MKKEPPKPHHFLLVSCVDKDHIIQYRDIICIGVSNSQACIYTRTGSKHDAVIVVCKSLDKLEELLPPEKFYRCHRSWIVHLEYVLHRFRGDNHVIEMFEGREVPLSREHKDGFLPALELYNSTI